MTHLTASGLGLLNWSRRIADVDLAGSIRRAEGGPMRFLIFAAIVIKACSTSVAFLADVSRKGMFNGSA